jgi:segregation and condensation protein A
MDYKVRLEKFEGPLDLLLYLIKKQEVDIYDIPISKITEQYLEYIEMLEFLNLELAGEFLVMAATLMRIKARLLLPVQVDEEEEEIDPRQQLVQQLLEYQKFKAAATELDSMRYQRQLLFERPEQEPEEVEEEAEFSYSLFDLITAFKGVLEQARTRYMDVRAEESSIEEKMEYLKQRLAEKEVIAFEDLFESDTGVAGLIATFLAMLELLRLRVAKVKQSKPFGQIWIQKVVKERGDGGT